MAKTPGSAGNLDSWTFSCWVKREFATTQQTIFSTFTDSTHYELFRFDSDEVHWVHYAAADIMELTTNRLCRDPSAWYHLCFVYDSANGTAADRNQIWVNGVRQTSFRIGTNVDQNQDSIINAASKTEVGTYNSGTRSYGGYMAEVVFIDGSSLAPTNFGEFDSDSPTIWIPKDPSGLTFGTNGFWLDFEASDNLGNDANGGTDFTETNLDATDQATDSPSNNFTTLNPLINVNSTANYPAVYSEGNCKLVTTGDWVTTVSTFGATAGKWYAEIEFDVSTAVGIIGVIGEDAVGTGVDSLSNNLGFQTSCVGYLSDNRVFISGSASTVPGSTYTTGDIIQVALDMDNGNVYFGKNDTWQNSGDPESGATGTGAYAIGGPAGQFWFFSCGPYPVNDSMECNFGGCSAFTVSSGNADANDYGNFEYEVPDGYYALCTKNLAEFGG